MKRIINKSQQFCTIIRVLNNYPEVFDNKKEALEVRKSFVEKSDAISLCISRLVIPYTTLYQNRKTERSKLKADLRKMLDMGIVIAHREQNVQMMETLKEFIKRIRTTSSSMMIEIARWVIATLRDKQTMCNALGLSVEDITAFEMTVNALEQAKNDTFNSLDERRNTNQQVGNLIKECNAILALELDRLIRYNANTHPELYYNYMHIRRVKHHKAARGAAINSIALGMASKASGSLSIRKAGTFLLEKGVA